MTNFIMNKHKI